MNGAALRDLAAELEREMAAMPAVEDAVSDRQREERDQALRAADKDRHAVGKAAQRVAKAEAVLAEMTPWRAALVKFSQEVEEELNEVRANLPPRTRSGRPWTPQTSAGDLGAILHSIDHYFCLRGDACGWLGREAELAVKTNPATFARYYVCPSCDWEELEPPRFGRGFSGTSLVHPALRERFPRSDWERAPDFLQTTARIERAQLDIEEALERIAPVLERQRQRAA